MGKQGPCYHCGITYTPLWRNGPPEKPILCNACGSRWRTKGTLANYTPLHARTFEAIDSSDYKGGRGKKGLENSKEQRFHKRKQPGQNAEFGVFGSDSHYVVGSEEDASNRSSSGSGISYSEGCIQYCGTVGTDSAGSVHAPVWDSPIPSKKRTCMYRKRPSSVEKLTKGLRYILHEQDTSYLSFCSESDDLLFQCKAPMVAAEIGIGSVFIRQPQSTPWEEESEASSLLVENKYNTFGVVSQADSKAVASSIQLHNGDGYLPGKEKEKMKQVTGYKDLGQEHSDRSLMPTKGILDNFPCNKHDVLQSSCSPLIFVELKDIINFDSFMGILTAQDQMHLFKYLSSVDVDKLPESLRSMFSSVQFEEALINFQELLSEGIFDTYELGLNPDVQQSLQNLITTDLSNYKWIERYSELLNRMKRKRVLHSAKVVAKNETKGLSLHSKSGTYVTLKNSSRSEPSQVITGSDNNMKSLGNRQKVRIPSSYHESMDTGCISKSTMDFDVEPKSDFCFSPSSLFASPVRRSSILLDSIGILGGESFEQDLLLDVPSNVSFQQAELFHNPDWKCKTSKNSLADAGNNENQISEEKTGINLWGTEDSLEWSSLSWNHSSVQSGQSLPNGAVLYPGKTP